MEKLTRLELIEKLQQTNISKQDYEEYSKDLVTKLRKDGDIVNEARYNNYKDDRLTIYKQDTYYILIDIDKIVSSEYITSDEDKVFKKFEDLKNDLPM